MHCRSGCEQNQRWEVYSRWDRVLFADQQAPEQSAWYENLELLKSSCGISDYLQKKNKKWSFCFVQYEVHCVNSLEELCCWN